MNTAITNESAALLERVRKAKQMFKLSNENVANAAGMYRPTVCNQLQGRYNLDIRVVLAVARLCPEVSAEWLLRGSGDILRRDSPDILARIERLESLIIDTK